MELIILSVGKTRERWLDEGCAEYIKRLQPVLKVTGLWVRDDAQLLRTAQQQSRLLCLDSRGPHYTSEEFSSFLLRQLESGRGRLCAVIGGPEGLPSPLKEGHPL